MTATREGGMPIRFRLATPSDAAAIGRERLPAEPIPLAELDQAAIDTILV